MTIRRIFRSRAVTGLAVAGLVAAGAIGLSPSAAGAPGSGAQPRGAQDGSWSVPGAGFAASGDDTLSQVFQLTSRSQLPDRATGADPIYAAGTFIASGGTTVNRVARWNGSAWVPLPGDDTGIAPGFARSVQDKIPSPGVYGMALGGDDSLYAGGQFWGSDDSLNNVGQWNGTDWVRMGNGLRITNSAGGYVVQDMVVGNDFLDGNDTDYADDTVYALGGFTHSCATLACNSNGRTAEGVAQYSQADDTWLPMANGAISQTGPNPDQAFAGAYIDDTLYVGGNFTSLGGVGTMLVAQWRESDDTWLPLGAGLGTSVVAVYAMAVHPSTKDLYVGGTFGQAVGYPAGSAPGIIKWDYTDDTWYSVGTGLTSGNVDDIAFSADGRTMWLGLDAGLVDGASANFVARLSSDDLTRTAATTVGGSWDALTSGGTVGVMGPINGTVNQQFARTVLALPDGTAMFGGNFHTAGPVTAGRVATFAPTIPPDPAAPVYPPAAPSDVVATAAGSSVRVTWRAPSVSGSYPVTNYLAKAIPGGEVCVTGPTDERRTECTFTGLSKGTTYVFTVQALNGAGWGEASAPSNAVSLADLRITSSTRVGRASGGSTLQAAGVAEGYATGTAVVPWIRIGASGEWREQAGSQLTVDAAGRFAWKRHVSKSHDASPVAVKFSIGSEFTNTVVLRRVS